jgi:hypothetical protein
VAPGVAEIAGSSRVRAQMLAPMNPQPRSVTAS